MSGGRVPLDERHELVRSISIVLARKNGAHASAYWRGMARRLLRLSMALGASREAAEAELHRLLDKVLREITQRQLAA
ncbi:MAG: hypothetical protein JJ913_07110 [Rhizobiaceae bacterium]|nr:hypothetical protein [Rhizobiaceae bacterium]